MITRDSPGDFGYGKSMTSPHHFSAAVVALTIVGLALSTPANFRAESASDANAKTIPTASADVSSMKSTKTNSKKLSPKQREELLKVLQARFEKNMNRHPGLDWTKVQARLEANPEKLWSLNEMERTGGEPDVVAQDARTGEVVFYDCAQSTPAGRVSLCYDDEALASRKEHKPKGSAVGMAADMGIELLTEEEYFALQKLGEFDTKRSSWLKTPADFRQQGGALWGGRSYGRVFIGCNGAESYYAARGFRGVLRF